MVYTAFDIWYLLKPIKYPNKGTVKLPHKIRKQHLMMSFFSLLSLQLKEYNVVGRAYPSEKVPTPALYRMRIFANDEVVAKSRFWYFAKKLKKIKKTNGEIVCCQRVSWAINMVPIEGMKAAPSKS